MSAERKPTRQARAFVTALTLAASPCVDMSRCRRSSSHSRARNACVLFLFLSIRRSHYLFPSALFKSFSNGKSYYGTSCPNRWRMSHCPIGSVDQLSYHISSQNLLESWRMNFNDRLLSNTLTRRIVLSKMLRKNSTTRSGPNSIWSWPRADRKWSLSVWSYIFMWCRVFWEGSSLNIEIHKHFKRPTILRSKDDILCSASIKFDDLWDHLASEAQQETNCELIFVSIISHLLRAPQQTCRWNSPTRFQD